MITIEIREPQRASSYESIESPKAVKSKKRKTGRKTPITLTIDAKLLTRIDQMAEAQGVSRAAIIAMGMHYVVEHGILKA